MLRARGCHPTLSPVSLCSRTVPGDPTECGTVPIPRGISREGGDPSPASESQGSSRLEWLRLSPTFTGWGPHKRDESIPQLLIPSWCGAWRRRKRTRRRRRTRRRCRTRGQHGSNWKRFRIALVEVQDRSEAEKTSPGAGAAPHAHSTCATRGCPPCPAPSLVQLSQQSRDLREFREHDPFPGEGSRAGGSP